MSALVCQRTTRRVARDSHPRVSFSGAVIVLVAPLVWGHWAPVKSFVARCSGRRHWPCLPVAGDGDGACRRGHKFFTRSLSSLVNGWMALVPGLRWLLVAQGGGKIPHCRLALPIHMMHWRAADLGRRSASRQGIAFARYPRVRGSRPVGCRVDQAHANEKQTPSPLMILNSCFVDSIFSILLQFQLLALASNNN